MEENEMQGLLERIHKMGTEEAEQKKSDIITTATAEATQLIEDAEKKAATILANAKTEAAKIEQKGQAALQQASRDVIISLKKSFEGAIKSALTPIVKSAMTTETIAVSIQAMVSAFAATGLDTSKGIEVILSDADKQLLTESSIAAIKKEMGAELTLTPVKSTSGGIQIGLAGDDAKYDITVETIAEMLCEFLSPQIAGLIEA